MRTTDVGGFPVALAQVYCGDDTCSATKHQGYAGGDQEHRGGDVDGSQGVAAYALSYEDAIGKVEQYGGQQSEKGREEQFVKQLRHTHFAVVQRVSVVFHIV